MLAIRKQNLSKHIVTFGKQFGTKSLTCYKEQKWITFMSADDEK